MGGLKPRASLMRKYWKLVGFGGVTSLSGMMT